MIIWHDFSLFSQMRASLNNHREGRTVKKSALFGAFSIIAASFFYGCALSNSSQQANNITFNPTCFKSSNWVEIKSGSRLLYGCPTVNGDTCSFEHTIAQLHFKSAGKTCATTQFTYDHGQIAPQTQCAQAYLNESKDNATASCVRSAS